MNSLSDWKKMPQEHYTEYKGRRMKVKEVVAFLEGELKRVDELLKRSEKDKQTTNIK